MQFLDGFQHGSVPLLQEARRDMHAKVWIDANEMSIECSVMDFRQWNSVRYDRLPKRFVFVGDDVGGIEEQGLG